MQRTSSPSKPNRTDSITTPRSCSRKQPRSRGDTENLQDVVEVEASSLTQCQTECQTPCLFSTKKDMEGGGGVEQGGGQRNNVPNTPREVFSREKGDFRKIYENDPFILKKSRNKAHQTSCLQTSPIIYYNTSPNSLTDNFK